MAQDADPDRWARLRFTIIGPLLAAPPPKGELGKSLVRLSQKSWRHPVNGIPVRFSAATLERWYYIARGAHDPVIDIPDQAISLSGWIWYDSNSSTYFIFQHIKVIMD